MYDDSYWIHVFLKHKTVKLPAKPQAPKHSHNLKSFQCHIPEVWMTRAPQLPIEGGFERGRCTELKYLHLQNNGMGSIAVAAFGVALSLGNRHHLGWLKCDGAFHDNRSLGSFLQSIRSISFPDMWFLGLDSDNMDEQYAVVLGEVFRAGALLFNCGGCGLVVDGSIEVCRRNWR